MRVVDIQVKPFGMVSVLSYEEALEMNGHGMVKISGLIPYSKKDEYIKAAAKETWAQVLGHDEENNEKTLFYGILTDFHVRVGGGSAVLDLALYSGSRLMDYTKHTRSFQAGQTYRKVAECCTKGYEGQGLIMTEGKDAALPGFAMQHGETDWQFLKRMASLLNTVLVPSCQAKGVKYFFGVPEKKAGGSLDTDSYGIHQGMEISLSGKAGGAKVGRQENTSYVAESRETYALGDQVPLNGELLHIWKVGREKRGNELWSTYHLKRKAALRVPTAYNWDFPGLSLAGRVKDVKGEQVKVALERDENPQGGQRWFGYSTVYSSPDGAGWYCMPEVGDLVRLCFPTEDEKEAYVSSAFHEGQGGGLRGDPSQKIWRNKQGKEIRLAPERVLLTNNKGMSVELSDQKGVIIHSSASVTVDAKDSISISSANANLELAAASRITLKQGGTQMELSDGIRLSGGAVKMQ